MTSSEPGHDEVSEFLFDIENRKELFAWQVEGLPIWEFIRHPLHRKILRGVRNKSSPIGEESYRFFAKAGYLWGRNVLVKNPFFGDCTVLGFGTGRRKQMDDGTWADIYFDPLYEGTDLNYLHVEQPNGATHKRPARTENVRYIDFIQYAGPICYRLGLLDAELSQQDRSVIADLEKAVEEAFGIAVDIEELVERKVIKSKAKKPLFDLFLQRVDPDIVLLVCSYENETFIKSCKQNGVPVVELQHGAITPYHPGYSFPGNRTKSLFPDYLFVFGEFWKENIEFPIPNDAIFPVGYPYQEQQTEMYRSVKTRDQLLFISQPSVGEAISEFAVELAADDRFATDIVYKIHPKRYDDWAEVYPWLAATDIEVIDSDSPPLYELLTQSQAILGVSSTAIYEAFSFGPEVYLLNIPSVSLIEWISHLENVHIIDSTDELISQYSGETATVETSRFFADDALARMTKKIEEISGAGYNIRR